MADVFLSYATANREFVNRIRYFLEQRKYSTWMDHRQIKPGDDWEEEIESNLQRCKVFIVTVTEESNKSRWVKRECFLAESLGKATIPILRNGKLPFRLMDLQYVDFQENELPFDYSFRLLLEVLKQHISDPSLDSRPRHQQQVVARQVPNYHIDKIQTRMYPEPDFVQQDCANHAKCLPRSKEEQCMEEITVENLKPNQYHDFDKLENLQTVLADVNEVRRQVDELLRQIELAISTEDYTKAKMLQKDLNALEATIHDIESSTTTPPTTTSTSSSAAVLDLNDFDLLDTRASLEAKLMQLEDDYNTAFDGRNFNMAREIVNEMNHLEKAREQKPSLADYKQQIHDMEGELEVAKIMRNIDEAEKIHKRLLQVEAKAKIEQEAEAVLGITVGSDGVVRIVSPPIPAQGEPRPSRSQDVYDVAPSNEFKPEEKPRALQSQGQQQSRCMEQPCSNLTDEGCELDSNAFNKSGTVARTSCETNNQMTEEDEQYLSSKSMMTGEESSIVAEAHVVESTPVDMEQQILDVLQRNTVEAVSVEKVDTTVETRCTTATERKSFARFFKSFLGENKKKRRQSSAPAEVFCLDRDAKSCSQLSDNNMERKAIGEARLTRIGKRDSIYYSRTV